MHFADYDALSFDCYGTLIDWEAGIADVIEPWALAHALGLDREQLLVRYADHEARVEREHPAMPYPEVLATAFAGLGEELGAEVRPADAVRLGSSVPDWPAFPDSAEALAELKKHYKLVILSNVDRRSFRGSNERLGVEFDLVLTAQDIGSYKPDSANFRALIEAMPRLDVGKDRLLHVAQSLFHDHVQAKRAGLSTVWINRRHAQPGWGATPPADAAPDAAFTSMAGFAAACTMALKESPRS